MEATTSTSSLGISKEQYPLISVLALLLLAYLLFKKQVNALLRRLRRLHAIIQDVILPPIRVFDTHVIHSGNTKKY